MSSNQIDKKLLDQLVDTEELYHNAPCGYLSFLPDGTIIKVNRTLLSWLGYESEDLLFIRKFVDLISKGAALHFEMFFRPLINATGVVNQLSYDVLKNDKQTFPVFLSAVASRAGDGTVAAINATLYDVRERVLYEQELLRSKKKAEAERKKFEFLSDFTPAIIWTATARGDIDYVNKRYYQAFNTSSFSIREAILRIYPADKFKLFKIWRSCIAKQEGFRVEIRLMNRAGYFEWHLVQGEVYQDIEQLQARWIGSCTNIDSQVKSIQKRDEFINIASHELKTPVTSLKAYHQILKRIELPDSANSFLSKAEISLNSLQFLISTLLDVSKIDSGQFSLNFSTFSIARALEDCIDSVFASQSTHSIEARYDHLDTFMVFADRQRIMQVIINLINNAIKYSPNANRVEVFLSKSENRKMVQVSIRDFGVGIPANELDLIFEKYYRVNETRNNNKASGLGLGLYIIQGIMKQHQSRVFVTSEINKGSCFYFSLPASEVVFKE